VVNLRRGLAGLPRTSWILAFATLVNRAGVMVRPFLVIYLTTQIGLTVEDAGWYLFGYGVTTLVAAPLSGRLTDRYGARNVMRVCLLLSACALLIYPLAHTRLWLMVATTTFALFNEMPRPALMALVTEVVPPESTERDRLSRLAINLGMAIGPALAGFLVAPRGEAKIATGGQFLALFLIDASSNFAAAAILWLTRLPRGAAHATEAAHPEGRGRALIADPRLRLLFVATALNAIVFWQHDSTLALYIKDYLHLTLDVFGRVFKAEEIYGFSITLNTLLIVLVEVELNFATHHWPQRRNLVIGALLVSFGFGGMAFAHGVGAIAVNVVLLTFGEMFLMPAITTYVLAIAPPRRRGSYMGVLTLSFGAGFSVGPWLGTRLLHHFGPVVLWTTMLAIS
jgi:MFS family permease